jgi:indoleamine 2,3-dioxygenase
LQSLPAPFEILDQILYEMPIVRSDGKPGLLSQGTLGEAILTRLPDLSDAVRSVKDQRLLSALFRDYSFLASAYLLEPCHQLYLKTKEYGLGRQTLPPQIAVPLCIIADAIRAKPFMEYAMSYALYNWKRKDPSGPISFENLELIRAFEGSKDEAGFVLVHVAMVSSTGDLVRSVVETLSALESKDRASFNKAFKEAIAVMQRINVVMDTMWKRSSPNAYGNFRTFIMGIKNQPMFPDGVLYEGVPEDLAKKQGGPRFQLRGESGANDSIVPTCDNLVQLTERMPENPLTTILRDFRSYRPIAHTEWLEFVEEKAKQLGLALFASEDSESSLCLLLMLDQIREFRTRHWNFTKMFIIRNTRHPVATGGSPIITWLPNQLRVVLQEMKRVLESFIRADQLGPEQLEIVERIKKSIYEGLKTLGDEVKTLATEAADESAIVGMDTFQSKQ